MAQIFLGTGYPVAFLSKQPLHNLKTFEGQKWRTASFWHESFLRNAQATPVSIPWGDDIFRAMQASTLDGLMVNVDSAHDLRIEQVAPNILLSKDLWLGHLYILAMNHDTWNGLAPEDREAVQRAASTAYTQLGRVLNDSFDTMVGDLKKNGATVSLLDRKELDAWKATTRYKDVQAAWVKDQQIKGVGEADTVLKKITELLGSVK